MDPLRIMIIPRIRWGKDVGIMSQFPKGRGKMEEMLTHPSRMGMIGIRYLEEFKT